ncbi:MAG: hypothetical protein AAGE65_14185 [Planctomycetota bacterium]
MPIFGLGMLAVLVVGAIAVIALLVGLARSGRGGRIAAIVVGLCLGLCLVLSVVGSLLVNVFSVRSMSYTEPAQARSARVSEIPSERHDVTALVQRHARVAQDPDVWHTAASRGFEADVYPSLDAGSQALARQAADWIAQLEQEPGSVLVDGVVSGDAAVRAARSALSEIMPALHPAASRADDGEESDVAERWTLRVRVAHPDREGGPKRLVWESDAPPWEGSVAVRDRPWVDDPNWSGNAQLGTPTVVGYSDGLFADPAEAETSAIASAAKRMHQTLPKRIVGAPHTTEPQRQHAAVEGVIHGHELIRDRFVQRIDRPYGRLYRAAVLVDAGSEARRSIHAAVEQVGRDTAEAAQAQQHRRFSQAVSIGVLVVLILLVYALLNALTKHYYLWPLRAAASFTAIVGLLFILMRI